MEEGLAATYPSVMSAIEEGEIRDLAELFKVMADPTRLQIMAILAHEELSVGQIAGLTEMSMSAVSHQLRILRRARLVRWQRRGREIHYALDDEHIEMLFEAGLEHCQHA
jgi:DNA-binding transcriptional ArsR family regulator